MQVIKGYPWPVAIAGQYAVAPNRRQKVPLRLKSPGVSIDSNLCFMLVCQRRLDAGHGRRT